ncbi:DUF3168 domain-containing protein [Brucella pseudogrignonensis]|uniref:DUF3168 domain-containing protein n=1 Tax=Brucella pseudogrignonensis TaxID=419475 RepID=A0ABU1M7K8_9HYPH|nr:DUF3168 domain-containing protein [Brucella pseudogrignonensis]MDR6432028.1 hypothetical protein [Brucella pseudogrignonensis]
MSVSVALQDLIISTLKADPKVSALVADRVYDGPPEKPTFPYISMGASDFRTDDADCINSREETIQIDCWVRRNGRKWPCKEIVDAIVGALRNVTGELSNGTLVGLNIELSRVLDDPDGITTHGVVQVTGFIDEEWDNG